MPDQADLPMINLIHLKSLSQFTGACAVYKGSTAMCIKVQIFGSDFKLLSTCLLYVC